MLWTGIGSTHNTEIITLFRKTHAISHAVLPKAPNYPNTTFTSRSVRQHSREGKRSFAPIPTFRDILATAFPTLENSFISPVMDAMAVRTAEPASPTVIIVLRIFAPKPFTPRSTFLRVAWKPASCASNSTTTVPAFNGLLIFFTFSVANGLAFTINMMYNTGV